MNTNRDLERRLADFYATEAAQRAPDRVLGSVLATTETTRQRRVLIRVPWRVPTMNTYAKVALAAVVVIAVGALSLRLFGPTVPGGVGGEPTASPSHSPSPSPSPTPFTPPAPTETFTSERHGFSMSYPTGWVARPATEPWTTGIPDFGLTAGDIFHDPVHESNLWIVVASQPIGPSTFDEWAAEKLAFDDGCATSEPFAVDGVTGAIGVGGCTRAAVTTDGRAYFFWLYTSSDVGALAVEYDRAWFEEVLATVQLQPEDAVD